MLDFLSAQGHIKKVYTPDTPTPRLQMYREEGDEGAGETVFLAHVPSSMVKTMLTEKNLVRSRYEDL